MMAKHYCLSPTFIVLGTILMVPYELAFVSAGLASDSPTTRNSVVANELKSAYNEKNVAVIGAPNTCTGHKLLSDQPKFDANVSAIRKCCPIGESLSNQECMLSSNETATAFRPDIINATFYNYCIEDSELIDYKLSVSVGKTWNTSHVYEEATGDHLYVLQNGSLLIVYEPMGIGYDVFDEYCLDLNGTTHKIMALVPAVQSYREQISALYMSKFFRFMAAVMIISCGCLLLTGTMYIIVPRFRTLHGASLALHTFNLAGGYLLTAINYFNWDGLQKMEGNGVIQYFVTVAFMWQLTMCIDTIINVWFYLPHKIPVEGRYRGWILFIFYVLLSQLVPLLFPLLRSGDIANHDILYYMSQVGEDNHDDQWYFFGPILFIIIACSIMFIFIYWGFRKLNEIYSLAYIARMYLRRRNLEEQPIKYCSKEMEYVKSSAKSTCFLFIIQSMCFISELITFYMTTEASAFFEIINACQGVFILLIFILMPDRKLIIQQWWSGDQGSFVVENSRNQMNQRPRQSPARPGQEQRQQRVVSDREMVPLKKGYSSSSNNNNNNSDQLNENEAKNNGGPSE